MLTSHSQSFIAPQPQHLTTPFPIPESPSTNQTSQTKSSGCPVPQPTNTTKSFTTLRPYLSLLQGQYLHLLLATLLRPAEAGFRACNERVKELAEAT